MGSGAETNLGRSIQDLDGYEFSDGFRTRIYVDPKHQRIYGCLETQEGVPSIRIEKSHQLITVIPAEGEDGDFVSDLLDDCFPEIETIVGLYLGEVFDGSTVVPIWANGLEAALEKVARKIQRFRQNRSAPGEIPEIADPIGATDDPDRLEAMFRHCLPGIEDLVQSYGGQGPDGSTVWTDGAEDALGRISQSLQEFRAAEDGGEDEERSYVSDSNSYEVFVGQITPAEFVAPYQGNVSAAIDDFLGDGWPYPHEAPPSWLRTALENYISSYLEELTDN